jgi:hypothetical protein
MKQWIKKIKVKDRFYVDQAATCVSAKAQKELIILI